MGRSSFRVDKNKIKAEYNAMSAAQRAAEFASMSLTYIHDDMTGDQLNDYSVFEEMYKEDKARYEILRAMITKDQEIKTLKFS